MKLKLILFIFLLSYNGLLAQIKNEDKTNDNIEKIQVLTASDNLPLEVGTNIILNYTDSGLVKAKVFAPMLERYDNEKSNQSIMKNNIDTIVPFILEPDYQVIIYNTYSNMYEFKEKKYESSTFIYYIISIMEK